jgi:hypothetical protein
LFLIFKTKTINFLLTFQFFLMKKNVFSVFIFFAIALVTLVSSTISKSTSIWGMSGSVSGYICTTNNGTIALLTDAADAAKPNYYSFQPNKMPTKIGRKLVNATVNVHETYIFVQNGDGEKLLFHLSNSNLPNELSALDPSYKVSLFGLAKISMDTGTYTKILKTLSDVGIDVVLDFPPATCKCYDNSLDNHCGSGGRGSTSCSTSSANGSCSTSCSTGSYACCND